MVDVQVIHLKFKDRPDAFMHFIVNDCHGVQQPNTDEAIRAELARSGFGDAVSWERITHSEYADRRAKRDKGNT